MSVFVFNLESLFGHYCRIFSHLYGLEAVSLRYGNVFGPRQDPNSIYAAVMPKFIPVLLEGTPPVIYGDGKQSRDFTYVENVLQANLLAMTAPGIFGQVYNVTCGLQTTVNNLFSSLQEISARKIPAQYKKRRSGEVRRTLASIDLVRSHFGYEVKVELQEGLWAAWKWFQEKKG